MLVDSFQLIYINQFLRSAFVYQLSEMVLQSFTLKPILVNTRLFKLILLLDDGVLAARALPLGFGSPILFT